MTPATPRVAFDVTPLQNGHRFRGIGRYVRGLAEALNQQDEVPIEFWGWDGERPLQPGARHSGQWIARSPLTPQYRAEFLFARAGMRRHAARSDAPVVHVSDPSALVALAGRCLLTTVHDLTPSYEGFSARQFLRKRAYDSYLRTLPRVDRVFAVSQSTADDLVSLLSLDPRNIAVAPNGLSIRPRAAPLTRPRPYFLYFSGPDRNKNFDLLLEALALHPELPEDLVVTGRWLEHTVNALDKRVASNPTLHGRVTHLGYVDDEKLCALMAGATAVVVPSRREGFGYPVAEAMAAGAAVAHSDIPAMREVSAGAAVTFDPGSAVELGNLLVRLSTDPGLRAELRRTGLARAERFTWERALEVTLETYREELRRANASSQAAR
ncbi:MAG: glycosyltransferase family 4 protein [Candidatus Dormibacteria bacterium]